MSIINTANSRKNDEESYNDALKYINTVFPVLPDYSNFKLSSIIPDVFRKEKFYQELYACHNHLDELLKREGYIETGTAGNLTRRLTNKGRDKKREIAEQIEFKKLNEKQVENPSFEDEANAVIEVLMKQRLPYLYAIIYDELKEKYPHIRLHEITEELKRLNLIAVGTDRGGHETYLLTRQAKKRIAQIPTEFVNTPYDYLYSQAEQDALTSNEDVTEKEFYDYKAAESIKEDGFFSKVEIKEMNKRLDEILQTVSELKAGQEVIWTDLLKEIEELKKMYFLNKKNWRQVLAGKFSEMVIGGVVSETLSKQIIESVNPIIKNLLS
jgi:hypothetical protein